MNTSVLDSWRAPGGAGYDPSAGRTAERVVPMLAGERVAWLSTVRPDGTPHLVPTWFWWDGDSILVFSKPGAVKVRNLRANPRLMVALGDPDDDFAVGLIEAEARVADSPAQVPDAFFAKYADELGPGRLDPVGFRELYTQAIRIVPTRYLAWHGRGEAHDARGVATPTRPVSRLQARIANAVGRLGGWLHRAAAPHVPVSATAGA
jgi:PPOX class probable F420-dependent enzyme